MGDVGRIGHARLVGRARRLGHVLLLALVVAAPVQAQTRRPMTLVDLAELPRIAGAAPQLSPDGKAVAYLLTRTDWKTSRLVYQVWRQEIGGGAPTQLTFTEGGVQPGAVRWSPDGKTLLFLRDGQIALLPADGGEARALTRHSTGVNTPAWSPDGSAVYFLASDPQSADERERARVRDDVFGVDESYKQRHLWKIAVATGVETAITSGDASVIDYRVSVDGTRIAMSRAPSPLASDQYRAEAWVMDANGEHARVITSDTVEQKWPELSPDNSQVLFITDANERFEPYYQDSLYIVPAAGGAARPAIHDFPYAIDQATWSADGASIIVSANMGVHSELFQVDVASRRARQLTDGEHFVPLGWSVVRSANTIVFQLDEPTRFGDIWTLPLGALKAAPTRVTRHFDAVDRDRALPQQERIEWKGADGTTIEGILFYPVGYQRGQKYPLVVQLHGGPAESDKFGAGPGLLLNFFPVLAAKGYAVLRPNYRGSTGYGNAFFRDVVPGYFNNMTSDVLTGVDALIQRGIVDPDRLVAMGFSAGGTLVNRLIGATDRFKAASSGAGIANWVSLWAQTDNLGFRRTWFGGTPWQKNAPTELFWSRSPLKDVANVKTPTVFFGGESDQRVPLAQSLEMYRALKSNGVPTRLYAAPREGHQWSELRHQLFKANVELEWFEKYLSGRPYVWEVAPSS